MLVAQINNCNTEFHYIFQKNHISAFNYDRQFCTYPQLIGLANTLKNCIPVNSEKNSEQSQFEGFIETIF